MPFISSSILSNLNVYSKEADLSNGQKGDPVIVAVLDQFFDISQIDPASVSPDERLEKDVGLDRVQIQTLLWKSAQAIQLPVPFEQCRVGDMSQREIVELLKTWQSSSPGSMWVQSGRAA